MKFKERESVSFSFHRAQLTIVLCHCSTILLSSLCSWKPEMSNRGFALLLLSTNNEVKAFCAHFADYLGIGIYLTSRSVPQLNIWMVKNLRLYSVILKIIYHCKCYNNHCWEVHFTIWTWVWITLSIDLENDSNPWLTNVKASVVVICHMSA